jgi:hypothetical protein
MNPRFYLEQQFLTIEFQLPGAKHFGALACWEG